MATFEASATGRGFDNSASGPFGFLVLEIAAPTADATTSEIERLNAANQALLDILSAGGGGGGFTANDRAMLGKVKVNQANLPGEIWSHSTRTLTEPPPETRTGRASATADRAELSAATRSIPAGEGALDVQGALLTATATVVTKRTASARLEAASVASDVRTATVMRLTSRLEAGNMDFVAGARSIASATGLFVVSATDLDAAIQVPLKTRASLETQEGGLNAHADDGSITMASFATRGFSPRTLT